ncbi:unnamed protein product (mitochondrion) [Plasmodiophora brassicae]|uniref:Dynein intermediate chain n=1 Tax=Plasmodiophora brassicae TaxID=37360 RepID=A0A3P3Y010_PLABS|nr:unnamed protein product [Plasmodiophora brassicae]
MVTEDDVQPYQVDDAVRRHRQEEIERKRQRLAELRRQRQQRRDGRTGLTAASFQIPGRPSSPSHILAEVDRMLASFGAADEGLLVAQCPTPSPSSNVAAIAVQTDLSDDDRSRAANPAVITYDKTIQTDVVEEHIPEPVTLADDTIDGAPHQQVSDEAHAEIAAEPGAVGDLAANDDFASAATPKYLDDDDEDERESCRGGALVKSKTQFSLNDCTDNHPVSSLDSSSKHPELILASYAREDTQDSVLIWSVHSPSVPLSRFQCQSTVLCAKFYPSNSHLVVGSTRCGQIVVWDRRTGKHWPVSSTTMSHGHVHPVYDLAMTPMNSLVSASTDGRLCVWTDKVLKVPAIERDVSMGSSSASSKGDSLFMPTCLGLSAVNHNLVHFGSENGSVYRSVLQAETGEKVALDSFPAHPGFPVTSLRFHPAQRHVPQCLFDLYLTSSVDWTIALWSVKQKRGPAILTFQAEDSVTDADWSPVHPSLFASVDESGSLDLWQLSASTDVPAWQGPVTNNNTAATRLSWSADGRRISIGDTSGTVSVVDVSCELARPTQQDGPALASIVQQAVSRNAADEAIDR